MLDDFRADVRRLKAQPGYRGIAWWMLDQSFWVILTYRLLSTARGTPLHAPVRVLEKIAEFVFKCYLPTTATIGPGLVIWHAFGIIVNGKTRIGANCTLYARVCIGNRWPGDGTPVIGDNVTIGTGACIFGPVVIPDHYVVKANAVITPSSFARPTDRPPHTEPSTGAAS
ncbi:MULTISPECIES: DapH/DapD/GlmU-related protein [unclassified Luteibacter]|uniref:serine O-acetyltransferase n=1 Tax=unclassified Luteibacter TaxID=2620188 RepID=UPI0008CE003F|nr:MULTISPECIES: DapH/DapD/GlmU-related protein [unclassified Luteibacter]MDR6935641.1 serine O-acetyltransferase [Luteibacter sp. 3190]SEO94725.1 serine O-acetyltransferase [Luteibacter sp. UNC138MFCol5.1]SEV93164.1 serine O-acetyltransferase [Luteibacter sp. 329MFSha]